MKKLLTLFVLAVMAVASYALNPGDKVDLMGRVGYTWGDESWSNEDGVITFNSVQWGGLGAWIGGEDWSGYSKVVYEFAEPLPFYVQINLLRAEGQDGYTQGAGEGSTSVEMSFEDKDVSYVSQIALQASGEATLLIKAIYLVVGEEKNPGAYTDLIINGDCEGEDASCFFAHEWIDDEYFETNARLIVDPTDYSNHCVVVSSRDQPEGQDTITDWDSQFFLTLAEKLEAGDQYKVSFRVRADVPAKAQTQAHNQPGDYIHWNMLGDIDITDQWVTIEKSGTITQDQAPSDREMHTIAFNLAILKEANNYYFDDIKWEVKKADPVNYDDYTELITNGDCEGEETVNFTSKEFYDEEGNQYMGPSRFVVDPTDASNKCIEVVSRDPEGVADFQDWDCQFFITVADQLVQGDQYRVKFRVRAEKEANSNTQSHNQPGDYIHWAFIGDVPFTTEWVEITRTGVISADQAPADKELHTIAFNLSVFREANKYYFDDISFEVLKVTPPDPDEFEDLIINGDCEGEETTNFVSKEYYDEEGNQYWGPSRLVVDPTDASNKCIEVISRDPEGIADFQDWDCQFFITVADKLEEGDQYQVSFRVRADKAANSNTQAHNLPGDYNHWAFIGDVAFTDEWVEITRNGTISADQTQAEKGKECHTIAFNLSVFREANKYYFDDIVFKVKKLNPVTKLIGDANADGQVTVQDVQVAVAYVLSGDESFINLDNADVSGDGIVTIQDVQAIVNIVLNGQ